MAEKSTVARPYAQAAFELAAEQKALAAWSEMLAACLAVANDPAMRGLLGNPRVPRDAVGEIFLAACGDSLDQHGSNFVKVLLENRRLGLLPEIAEQYAALRAEAEKTVEARVAAAFELSQAQQAKLTAALKNYLGREVKLVCEVDKTLLGGAVIQAGDKVIDGSALGRLARLAGQMEG
ncbi:MAG TPA: F0F1 ATP synthase subunit delta [Gammaproteobacteria bacterium]